MSGLLGGHFGRLGPIKAKEWTGNGTATLTPDQRINRVTTDGSGARTLKLPHAADVPGDVFTFELVTDGGTDMVIQSQENTARINLTFNDAGDRFAVWSNGMNWFILENVGGV